MAHVKRAYLGSHGIVPWNGRMEERGRLSVQIVGGQSISGLVLGHVVCAEGAAMKSFVSTAQRGEG